KVLGQMLVTNQCLDKLAAACADFANHGMLDTSSYYPQMWSNTTLHGAEQKCARNVLALTAELNLACFPGLICCFLFEQTHRPDDNRDPLEVPLAGCPRYEGKLSVFNSASSRFYAPSDLSGVGGMQVKHICACSLWQNEAPHNDCIFVNTGTNAPDLATGMWMIVHPVYSANCTPIHSIIHVDTIYHAAHLIPMYGHHFISPNINLHVSYDSFHVFYVNKYVDHHTFEIAS
ncbi:hypothetical protein BDR07DRAFT_1293884, partial [Suillus spraguei]